MSSRYEKLFGVNGGVRNRRRGRPVGRTLEDVVFSMADKEHEDLARLARQRAIAIALEEIGRDYLRSLYENEYKVLRNRRNRGEG